MHPWGRVGASAGFRQRSCGPARGVLDARGRHSIDTHERERGRAAGKPREKFVRVQDMLGCVETLPQHGATAAGARQPAGTMEAFEAGTDAGRSSGRY